MHTYLVKVHVWNVGVVEVSIQAYTPLDAQKVVMATYSGATLMNCHQVG